MNKFENMYVIKFLENGQSERSNGSWVFPNFKNIFVLDFFYLPNSFLQCDMVTQQDYYERCDEILKSVKIFP